MKKYNEKKRKQHALDYHFEETLRPLYQMQTILLIRKYKMENGAATNCDFRFFATILCSNLIMFILNIFYRIDQLAQFPQMKSNFLNVFNIVDIVWRQIGYIVNIVEFYNGDRFIKMLVYLQNANRLLMYRYNFTKLKLWSWIDIVIPIALLVSAVASNVILYDLKLWILLQVVNFMGLLFVDMNIMFAIHMMKLITISLKAWVRGTLKYSKHKIRVNRNADTAERLYEAYENILLAYDMYKEAFQLTVRRYNKIR
jgi:hypothetical protein